MKKKILWIYDSEQENNIVNFFSKNNYELIWLKINELYELKKYLDVNVIVSDYIIKNKEFNGLDILNYLLNKGYNRLFIMNTDHIIDSEIKEIFEKNNVIWRKMNKLNEVIELEKKNLTIKNVETIKKLIEKINGFEFNYLKLFDVQFSHRFNQLSTEQIKKILEWCYKRFCKKELAKKEINEITLEIYDNILTTEKEKIILIRNSVLTGKKNPKKIISDLYYEVEEYSFSEVHLIKQTNLPIIIFIENQNDEEELNSVIKKLNKKQIEKIIIFANEKITTLEKYDKYIDEQTIESRINLDKKINEKIKSEVKNNGKFNSNR